MNLRIPGAKKGLTQETQDGLDLSERKVEWDGGAIGKAH